MPKSIISQLAISLALCNSALGQVVNGADYDKPNGGPPASFFAAASTMPVAALQAAAAKASQVPSLATYPVSQDPGAAKSTIHTDWASFSEGASISWVADMDVDCDGLDSGCQVGLVLSLQLIADRIGKSRWTTSDQLGRPGCV